MNDLDKVSEALQTGDVYKRQGDEASFVKMMNERARGLGMKHANFEDCCGLTDSSTHAMSARDIALMSRELITKLSLIHIS